MFCISSWSWAIMPLYRSKQWSSSCYPPPVPILLSIYKSSFGRLLGNFLCINCLRYVLWGSSSPSLLSSSCVLWFFKCLFLRYNITDTTYYFSPVFIVLTKSSCFLIFCKAKGFPVFKMSVCAWCWYLKFVTRKSRMVGFNWLNFRVTREDDNKKFS